MAKDFADINRLEDEAGLQATNTVSTADAKQDITSRFVAMWEKKNAQRALRGGAVSTMALTLAACGGDSDDPVVTPADPDPVTVDLTPQNEAEAIELTGNEAGAVINVADTSDNEYSNVELGATGVDGTTLTFSFTDNNAEDTVVLTSSSSISGFSVYEVVNGTVDFTELGAGVLTDATLVVGSGAILTAEQFTELSAVELRDEADSGQIEVQVAAGDDVAAVVAKLADATGVDVTVSADDNAVTTEQKQQLEEAGAEVSGETGGDVVVENTAPEITADATLAATEDEAVTFSISTDDIDGDAVGVTVAAESGTVVDNEDGTFTYTPSSDFNGEDTITVTATDANGGVTTQEIAVTVEAVNDAPVITIDNADTLAVDEDSSLVITGDVTDVDDDEVTVTASAENGSVVIDQVGGTVTYTPAANFNGEDTLTFTADDGNGGVTTQEIAVTVDAVNDAPTITSEETLAATEDTAASFDVSAEDVDEDTVTVTASAENGEVVDNEDGTFSYTGNADFNGEDTITVTADDGNGGVTTQEIAVTVDAVNDAPTLEAFEAASVEENTAADTAVATAAGSDVDSDDTLTYAITAGNDSNLFAIDEATGEITLASDAPSFEAGDTDYTLTVSVTDAAGETATQNLSVSITDVNEAPVVTSTTDKISDPDNADGNADEAYQLTDDATVTDPEANYNGGSVTITTSEHFNTDEPLSFAGANFQLVGSNIIADGDTAAEPVIGGGEDATIATVSYSDATDIDTDDGAGEETFATKTITITFNSDLVTDDVVAQLLQDVRVTDLQSTGEVPADTQGTVTVTVADADGASDSFTRTLDSDGQMTLENLDDDDAEIQVADASNSTIDGGNAAAITLNGADTDGLTVTVTSSVAGDAIHLENTTDVGENGQARVVSGEVVYQAVGAETGGQAGDEVIVGTVTGNNSDSLTITFNEIGADLTEANKETVIDNILQGLEVDYDTDVLGDRTITTSAETADGLDVIVNSDDTPTQSTKTLVGDFVDATNNDGSVGGDGVEGDALELATLAAATADNPVTINGNTYVEITANDDGETYDFTQLIADGAIVLPSETAVIRLHTDGAADLSGITGLGELGTLQFGTSEVANGSIDEDITVTAAQIDGLAGYVSAGTLTVSNVEDTLSVDLSGLVEDGGDFVVATATLTEDVTFTGDLGAATFEPGGDFAVTMTVDQADGKTINHDSGDAAGDIILTGLDADFAGDLGGVDTDQNDLGVVIEVESDLTLNSDAQLDSPDLELTVANNVTLTLDGDQATAIGVAGGNIVGDDAVGDGNTGGSLAVTLVDGDADTAGVQANAISLDGLEAGGIAVGATSATAGSVTIAVDSDTTLDDDTDFTLADGGTDAEITVASGVTLTGQAADLVTGNIVGAGSVTATDLAGATDLSVVGATGTLTAETVGVNEIQTIAVSADNAGDDDNADDVVTFLGEAVTGTADGDTVEEIVDAIVADRDDIIATWNDANADDELLSIEEEDATTLRLTFADTEGDVGAIAAADSNGIEFAEATEVRAGGSSFTGDFGNFDATAAAGETFQTTAAIVDGVTITGADAAADSGLSGASIAVTGLGADAVDLSGLSAGAGEGTGNDGTVTVTTADVDAGIELDADTNLGDAALVVDDTNDGNGTLTLSASQADGRTITDDGNESLVVTGLAADTDLSGIDFGGTGSVTANVDSSIDISANDNLGDVTIYDIEDNTTLTANAAQLDDISVRGGDGDDEGDVNNAALTVLADALATAGEGLIVDLTVVEASANLSFEEGFTVATGNTLRANAADLNEATISGEGTVVANALAAGTDLSGVTADTLNANVTATTDVTDNANLGGVDTFTISNGETLTVTATQADVAGREFDKTAAEGSGALTIEGTSGDEDLDLTESSADITVNLGSGDDQFVGGSGDDDITGGGGSDVITGGSGDDTINLTEGTAAIDTVVFSSSADNGTDTVTAFTSGAGGDVLDLSGVSANVTAVADTDGVIDATAPGDGNAVVDLDGAIHFIDTDVIEDQTALEAAITEAGDQANQYQLADDGEAIVFLGDVADGEQSFEVYHITGDAENDNGEIVVDLGTVTVSDGDALLAASNFTGFA